MLCVSVALLLSRLYNQLCGIVLLRRQRRRRPSRICCLDVLWKALAQDLRRGNTHLLFRDACAG